MKRALVLVMVLGLPAAGWSQSASQPSTADPGWPRSYVMASGARGLMHQPQVMTWDQQKHLVAWAVLSYQPTDAKEPVLGTMKIEADTRVALQDRLVSLDKLRVSELNFPSLSRDQQRTLAADVESLPEPQAVISLDRVLANIDKSTIAPGATDGGGLKADPPQIFYSTKPSILVGFDSQPIWSPIKEVDLKFAVNTNWDVFEHVPSTTFYLRNGQNWIKATKLEGPWTPAGTLPASFGKLPMDAWKDVRETIPGKPVAASSVPIVFVAYQPAELISLMGPPSYLAVDGTNLLWVSNTESDVFRLGQKGDFYYLVAGRWFSAPALTGPWTFATPKMPEDFRKIPVEHPRSRVLASVPGTPEAAEAVLLAQVPQTARVKKQGVTAPEVTYQGQPQFEAVPQTTVARAVNTDKDIIRVGDTYYMCFQGVWFASKSATGPWEVTGTIPKEVYEIPASSPAHHVTYVTVEDDDDDEIVYAAAAGYMGMMVGWGCAVWGTGWYYPPYAWYGGYYPVYYPYFPTYGYSAWYNPWTGTYGRGAAVYGPYGGAGVAARYNPRTGTYARGAAAWGPYGARGVAQAYNPRTGTYAATRQGSNIYGSWGSSYVQRGDDWARTNRVTNRRTDTTTRTVRTDEGGAITRRGPDGGGFVAGSQGGDIYAGHDGNIYRRQDGQWQQYQDGGWSNTDRKQKSAVEPASRQRDGDRQPGGSTGTTNQLDRDSAARREGSQRVQDYGTYRGGSSAGSARTYRPSGGARRGGGRRR